MILLCLKIYQIQAFQMWYIHNLKTLNELRTF